MADNSKYAQLQSFALQGGGAVAGATSITLQSMTDIDGTTLSMSGTFGTIGYGTLEPGNGTQEEQISFTGLVNNANGTVTLTGVSNISFVYPYTSTSGLSKTHPGNATFVISNTSGYYNGFLSKNNDETVTQTITFTSPNYPRMDSAAVAPTDPEQLATKKYVDDTAIAGAPVADTTTLGISKLSTVAADPAQPIVVGTNDTRVPTQDENDALVGDNTDIAVGTGNKYVTQTGLQKQAEQYGASAAGTDSYAVTLSPVPTSYSNGMVVRFKADVGNTGAATLAVNALGAITIKKNNDQDLVTGDIEANQIVEVVYNSTGPVFQMQSQVAATGVTDVQTITSTGAQTWTKPSGSPVKVFVQIWGAGGSGGKSGGADNGGGGGGGAYNEAWFDASALGGTETVTIGVGGASITAGGGGDGNVGGNTTFGSLLTAYGGGGGAGPTGSKGGGGGGGIMSAGATGSGAAGGAGGGPAGGAPSSVSSGFGGGSGSISSGTGGGASAWGGGGGGGGTGSDNGGSSVFGGGGGGTAPATGGTSVYGGAGGAGNTGANNATAGTQPGGGGGGSETGNSGAGGNGKAVITTFF